MRLMSMRDFLAGQSWFDMTQYRYLPPDGVTLHWSRLVELPIVGGILALTPFLGRELAEKVTVTAWPLVLFLVYAGVIAWGASRLFGARAAGFAVFVAAQMIVFRDLFAPGRIDHHNVADDAGRLRRDRLRPVGRQSRARRARKRRSPPCRWRSCWRRFPSSPAIGACLRAWPGSFAARRAAARAPLLRRGLRARARSPGSWSTPRRRNG